MSGKIRYSIIFCLIVSCAWLAAPADAQDMIDYTAYPPFVTTAIEPNILLVLDQSGSMQFPAYIGCENPFLGYDNKRADCGSSDSTLDPQFSYKRFNADGSDHYYYGYFKTEKYYYYGTNKFEESTAPSCKFNKGQAGYLIGNSATCISGNLLNWATMTRADLMRKVLIGGKSASTQGNAHTLRGEGGWRIFSDENLHCTFTLSGGSSSNLDHDLTISDYNGACAVGNLSNAYVKVDVPEAERRGIIHSLSDKDYDGNWDPDSPRFGLMFFADDSRRGEMKVGIEGANMSSFLTALQNEIPYSATPTGEALEEAYDYYRQEDVHIHEANSAFIGGPGSNKDPLYEDGNAIGCRKSFVLLISDGEWNGTIDPVVPARENFVNDIRTGPCDIPGPQNIITYTVCTFCENSGGGQNAMQQIAMHGDFTDYDANAWPYNRTAYPADSRSLTLPAAPCDPAGTMDGNCTEWDKDNDGIPDNYYESSDGNSLERELLNAISDILKRASSGTAVSVLATTGEGDGAVYQAYFFPEKMENVETRKWLGYMHSLFVDKYGNLREDTNGNKAIDMTTDLIIEMGYSPSNGTEIYKCTDLNGDGKKDSCSLPLYDLDVIKAIWKGGEKLWQADPANRTIFTTIDGYTKLDFETANDLALQPYLRAADTAESDNIINWIRGDDLPGITDAGHAGGYRKRDLTINNVNNVWKLGDIIHSTPTVVAGPMENYDLLYGDGSYTAFRKAHFNRRQVVYVGANDGMLHAFNGGCFHRTDLKFYTDVDSNGQCVPGSHTLGGELWAFIPRGLLPHLKWTTDPDYTHVYYVDNKPKVTDIRVFTPSTTHAEGWGTILIGSMRYGGKEINWSSGGTNYSASPEYFALDITDPLNPRILWTFSDPEIGLSMSYPAIARVNDEWFAIFGSGATDFNTSSNLTSFQNGNIFVLKLSSGTNGVIDTWTQGTNFWKIPTNNTTAFLATPITVDVDIDYDVDVMYIGENYQQGGNWNALMRRITTNEGSQGDPSQWVFSTIANVSNIAGAKDIVKRITAAPAAAMDDHGNLYTFFGTGQFYGNADKNHTDTGAFYAIKDGCWDGTCTDEYIKLLDVSDASVLTDGTVSSIGGACGGASSWGTLMDATHACDGWAMYFQNLREGVDFTGAALSHDGERVNTKPLVLGGLVTWATYIPGIDECNYEGESNIYAVYYKTGTAYRDYVFKEQKEQTAPSNEVARVKKLGSGMPSSVSAQITSSGTTKGFAQQSTGSILGIESINPISLRNEVRGWQSERIQ